MHLRQQQRSEHVEVPQGLQRVLQLLLCHQAPTTGLQLYQAGSLHGHAQDRQVTGMCFMR